MNETTELNWEKLEESTDMGEYNKYIELILSQIHNVYGILQKTGNGFIKTD